MESQFRHSIPVCALDNLKLCLRGIVITVSLGVASWLGIQTPAAAQSSPNQVTASSKSTAPVDITMAMRSEDSRLEKTVTISSPCLYVGDLLEQFRKQTGVDITAGENDGSADQQITVYLHQVPLGNALNALRAMFSYQGAPWLLTRIVSGKAAAFGDSSSYSERYAYRLLQPEAARHEAAKLRDAIQRDFESEAIKANAILKMSPEERANAAKTDPAVREFNEYGSRHELGLALFNDLFTPEQQMNILRGEPTARISTSTLPDSGSKFVNFIEEQARQLNAGTHGPWEQEAGDVRFMTAGHGSIAPFMAIMVGKLGGYGYLGGAPLERPWKARLDDLWRVDGDRSDNAADARKPVVAPAVGAGSNTSTRITIHELRQETARTFGTLAQDSDISLMARIPAMLLPGATTGLLPDPHLFTIADYRSKIRKDRQFASKWHDGVLLFSDMAWFRFVGTPSLLVKGEPLLVTVPWLPVRALRESQGQSPEHLPSMTAFAAAANALTDEQLKTLSREMPYLGGIAEWRELFATMDRLPWFGTAIQTEKGVSMAFVPQSIKEKLQVNANASDLDRPAMLRLVKQTLIPEGSTKAQYIYHIQMLTSSGRVLPANSTQSFLVNPYVAEESPEIQLMH